MSEKPGEKFVVGETNRKVQILYKFYKSRSRHGEWR